MIYYSYDLSPLQLYVIYPGETLRDFTESEVSFPVSRLIKSKTGENLQLIIINYKHH